VGLGVELDQGAGLAALAVTDVDGDEALGGGAALALGDALEALDADQLDGLDLVAVRLAERLLDVEHARAGGLAALLDVCCVVVGHVPRPCGEMLREGEAVRLPGGRRERSCRGRAPRATRRAGPRRTSPRWRPRRRGPPPVLCRPRGSGPRRRC